MSTIETSLKQNPVTAVGHSKSMRLVGNWYIITLPMLKYGMRLCLITREAEDSYEVKKQIVAQ